MIHGYWTLVCYNEAIYCNTENIICTDKDRYGSL